MALTSYWCDPLLLIDLSTGLACVNQCEQGHCFSKIFGKIDHLDTRQHTMLSAVS